MCVTHCAQTQDVGARGLSSVCRAGTTVGMAPVYPTATSTLESHGSLQHQMESALLVTLSVYPKMENRHAKEKVLISV